MSDNRERVQYERIWPIHPDVLQRQLLLEILERQLNEWDAANNPECTRRLRSLWPLFEKLRDSKGEEKVFYEMILQDVVQEEKTKSIDYALVKVSERKYVVVKKGGFSSVNLTTLSSLFGPYKEGESTPIVNYRPVTKNVTYSQAQEIYGCLVHGKEIPEQHERFMLDE